MAEAADKDAKKAADNAATIKPQIDDDKGPANYYRALKDVAAWMRGEPVRRIG